MHFARIEPIVGDALRRVRVAVLGLPLAAPLVEYLAACGVAHWLWDGVTADHTALAESLHTKHGAALGLRWQPFNDEPCDLIIGVGTAVNLAATIAQRHGAAALLIHPPTTTRACAVRVMLPDDDTQQTAAFLANVEPHVMLNHPAWHTSAYGCAGIARAILLRLTPFGRLDLNQRWQQGDCELYFDAPDEPLQVWQTPPTPQATFLSPTMRRGTALIAGVGSLGSVATHELAPWLERCVVLDDDHVESTNPVRQAFSQADIGKLKVHALQESLGSVGVGVIPINQALRDETQISRVIQQYQPDVAIIATGTNADFAYARACRMADVPHIVARCYPRARFWEAIVVDGAHGASLSDIRGRVLFGAEPDPTPEQRAAYSDAGALEAEPATIIESGWAAAWVARLARQMLAPPGLRERWMLELLAQGRTCLLGGVAVEQTAHGVAYGITQPLQIRALGVAMIRHG